MKELKEKALEKMLEEMNDKHSSSEDAIHNWLCDQDDEKLLEGILKEGRTIKGAMQYCVSQASKQQSGNAAMVDDQTVFSWVRKYFISEKELEIKPDVSAKVIAADKSTKKKADKKIKDKKYAVKDEGEQLSLLDFL